MTAKAAALIGHITGDTVPAIQGPIAQRVRGEFTEMPGMRLTVAQAERLFGLTVEIAEAVLDDLQRTSFLGRSGDGRYALAADPPGGVGRSGRVVR